MKKIILIASLILVLTGCNRTILDTTYTFNKAVCYYGNNEVIYDIDSWTDYEGEQIQIKVDGTTYLISMNQCYLRN